MRIFHTLICVLLLSFAVWAQNDREYVVVTATKANVRVEPSTSSKIASTVRRGAKLPVFATEGDWHYVSMGSTRGWMHQTVVDGAMPDFARRAIQGFANIEDDKIKGNRLTRIYHLPDCMNYDDIATRNTVWFKTTEAAEKAGYRIAENCP